MSGKTIRELTSEQMDRAILANRLQLSGCAATAKVIVDRLRREVRPNYGSFKLTEADECAIENVETPDR